MSDGARHHVVISGTGRAGTTFLVEFLAGCGLDVGAENAATNIDLGVARAGLEHHLLDPGAPYVVKDPFLHTYCDEIDLDTLSIDALVIPVRDLAASANSRVFQDRVAIAATHLRNRPPLEVRGAVDGGIVYSLDPVDEARLLAVGFHDLVRWATRHQIPLYFLDFPRAVTDVDYLIATLQPWLGSQCSEESARAAFAESADPSAVRFGGTTASDEEVDVVDAVDTLDRRALVAVLDERDAEVEALRVELEALRIELGTATVHLREITETRDVEGARRVAAEGETQRLSEQLAAASAEIEAMRQTLSWRVTTPLRAIKGRDPSRD